MAVVQVMWGAGTPRPNELLLAILTGASLSAALKARSKQGYTVLGVCVAYKRVGWIRPMLQACRWADPERS